MINTFIVCSQLTDAVFSEGVTSIGNFAFSGCSGLTDIIIPATVTTIGTSAFSSCNQLASFTIEPGDSQLTLNGPVSTGGSGYALSVGRDLTLKSGYGSQALFPNATSAELGGNMTTVNKYLFFSASSLASVTIGSSVTSIGEQAFAYSGLTSVTIPGTVTSIGNNAFARCTQLTKAVFSEGVTTIGGFSGCSSLASVTIPSTVTTIDKSAFYGSGLTSFTVPSTVTTIGTSAFDGCTKLASFTIEPGDSQLTLNGPVSTGGTGYALSVGRNLKLSSNYSSQAFFPNATSAELGGNMTTVNKHLFYSASSLASVTFGSSVSSIGEYAFGYSGLTSVTIPGTVTSIGNNAFARCTQLTEAVFSEGVTTIGGFSYCSSLASVTIPSTVTTIDKSAFYGSGLTSFTVPSTVTTIGTSAFSSCNQLASFTIEPGDSQLTLNSPVSTGGTGYALSVGRDLTLSSNYSSQAFFPNATSAELGGNMTTVNKYLFSSASSLASVTFGSSVTSIGEKAFSYSGLTSVTIPGTVTSIGNNAFQNCSQLTEAVFSEGVTSIGNFAFSGCSGLTDIIIPATVTTIGTSAFSSCTKLASFTIEPVSPPRQILSVPVPCKHTSQRGKYLVLLASRK